MNMKHKQEIRRYPESFGNLAVAVESVNTPQVPKVRGLSSEPTAARDISEGKHGIDPLGPSKGIILGVGLSIMLWWIIILVISWVL